MAITSSPWKSAVDSPSRQLLWELSRLGVASQEDFNARLDGENREREMVHKKALAAAAAEHDRVRESAESVRKELEQQVQDERLRREEEAKRRAQERKKQEQVARGIEVKRLEEEKKQQQLARVIKEKKQLGKEKAKTAEKNAELEQLRREEAQAYAQALKAEKQRQDSEAAALAKKEKHNAELQRGLIEVKIAQQKPASITQTTPAAVVTKPHPPTTAPTPAAQVHPTQDSQREAEHKRYLVIHKRLKELRTFIVSGGAGSPDLKRNMGDMRREIRKSVGQLRVGQGTNKVPVTHSLSLSAISPANLTCQLQNIINTLRSSLKIPSPQIPILPFLFATPSLPSGTSTTGPSLLLYLLNIFSKSIIAQLISEAGIETAKADPIGTIASHIFALKDFLWNEHTLIDILIAKYHVVCPVLFGIYGPDSSAAGKMRLGWAREGSGFTSLQNHSQRMAGLGAGYAGISLRNYEKAVHKNPYPATNYWIAFANIVNVPKGRRTETHATVLRAMIEGYEERYLLFFGDAARCALRLAVVDFPKGVEDAGMGTRALELLGDVVLKERKIRI